MTTIVGIDPGAAGAIAQISPMIGVWRMPKSDRALVDLLQMFDPNTTRVYLERAQAMPKKAARQPPQQLHPGNTHGGPLWKLGARVVVIPATPRRGPTSTLAVTAAGWIAPDSVASVAVDG